MTDVTLPLSGQQNIPSPRLNWNWLLPLILFPLLFAGVWGMAVSITAKEECQTPKYFGFAEAGGVGNAPFFKGVDSCQNNASKFQAIVGFY